MATFDNGEWNDLIPCPDCKALVFNRDLNDHLVWHGGEKKEGDTPESPFPLGSTVCLRKYPDTRYTVIGWERCEEADDEWAVRVCKDGDPHCASWDFPEVFQLVSLPTLPFAAGSLAIFTTTDMQLRSVHFREDGTWEGHPIEWWEETWKFVCIIDADTRVIHLSHPNQQGETA